MQVTGSFRNVSMCQLWIWEQIAIISLYSINWLVCIAETESVYCAVRTESLNIIQFMCFLWIWEQTAIISLYSINWLVCITETECVYCGVRAESLYTSQYNLSFWSVNAWCYIRPSYEFTTTIVFSVCRTQFCMGTQMSSRKHKTCPLFTVGTNQGVGTLCYVGDPPGCDWRFACNSQRYAVLFSVYTRIEV
jgi:hypothetical protein